MIYGNEKYLIVFSSNYHGYYFEDLFKRGGIKTTLRKAPREVGKSCQTAIYVNQQDFDKAIEIIMKTKIRPNSIYEVIRTNGMINYIKLEIAKG